jgi:C4-dicarboxylate-specific signal transduction histidine kinase
MEIPRELQIQIAAGAVCVLSLLVTLVCIARQRKSNRVAAAQQEQIEELQNTLKRTRETIESNAQLQAEMSRRLVWVETKIRQPKLAAEEVVDDTTEAPKLNITERRHQVVTLASRGQDPQTIASTIGMLPGEVELILSLDQAARAGR